MRDPGQVLGGVATLLTYHLPFNENSSISQGAIGHLTWVIILGFGTVASGFWWEFLPCKISPNFSGIRIILRNLANVRNI